MDSTMHTQYQRELDALIGGITNGIQEIEDLRDAADGEERELHQRQIGVMQELRDLAETLIVRDDLDEMVAVAQRLFPDGYKALSQTLSEARTALDDPAGIVGDDDATDGNGPELGYAIDKLDEAINVLVYESDGSGEEE